jgi:hypothetical protein
MSQRKKFKRVAAIIAMSTILGLSGQNAFANWSYSNYNNGSYVPLSGTDLFTYDSTEKEIHTSVGFNLDSSNVSSIQSYNNGSGTGGSCSGKKAYLTVDFHAIPENSLDLEIGADVLTTNLPDPKIDYDNWSNYDWDYSEAEVTALGAVSASYYWARVDWDDFRDGDSNDGGRIQLQFAMSAKGISEYNNCVQSSAIQQTWYYGDNKGQL